MSRRFWCFLAFFAACYAAVFLWIRDMVHKTHVEEARRIVACGAQRGYWSHHDWLCYVSRDTLPVGGR